MPSQTTANISQSFPLCLPLEKFSYATMPNESILPIPWIHLHSKDTLFAIFETGPVQLEDGRVEERQTFKVLHDPEVMEELDLHALSVEAHRAIKQIPNDATDTVPLVTILFQVSIIAIKYPLPCGQIRRFQIRFSKEEDYCKAMRILSWANVPILDPATFPTLKSRAATRAEATRSAAPNPPAPGDSASQNESSLPGKKKHTAHDDMIALSLSQPGPGVQSAMPPPPPQMFLAPPQSAQYSSSTLPPPALGPTYANSNVSLSTATTLVAEKQQVRTHGMHSRTEPEGAGESHGRRSTRAFHDSSRLQTSRGATGLGLRGGHLASRPVTSEVNNQTSMQGGEDGNPVSRKGRNDKAGTDVGVDSELTTIASTEGRGKRGATNKTAKTPATKKPRSAATHKRTTTTTKKAQEDKGVPTVDELHQQPECSMQPNSTIIIKPRSIPRTANNSTGLNQTGSMEIDETEHEADQAPAQGSPCLGGTVNRRLTRSQALSGVSVEPVEDRDRDVYNAALTPCTPADQIIIDAATPASPAFQGHNISLAQPKSFSSHQEPQIFLHSQIPRSSAPAPADVALLGLAQECLSADPAFDLSSAQSRLETWSRLPEPTQATALRSYFCDLIMTDGFAQLCKTVDVF
ncbi:hypothetical protein Z517_06791 [Fonsecaea pedrosoi CBS 271.37]|uniref:Unplaced genomic scaffold supercont1.4, whole genome shotgun sequence n=1 Tax=Fonsecaea pedrosoi CBS 271.37 TaxID=1442368 RepID=A0A0D2DQT2_9EURO|nr:uncharacterized protein Z517_06791 [Fonsecaea pedrosoi CBS 271.37]KIW80176.1 hypothetical protein Z517_06791 [Fonsecaea pedrosoi CBS 271.37]